MSANLPNRIQATVGKIIQWQCPLCFLSSVQDDAGSFRRHLESLHAEELESKLQISPEEAQRFREQVVEAAFSLSTLPTSPGKKENIPRSQTLDELGRLKISSPGPRPPESWDPPGKAQARIGRPLSVDDSQLGQSSTLKQVLIPRPTSVTNQPPPPPPPPPANQDFTAHSSANRPVSREHLEQNDDDHRRRKAAPSIGQPSPTPRRQGVIDAPSDPRYPGLIMQPDSRGISHEQLGKEVRAIYAGLTMVEAKAISLDKAKMEAAQTSRLPSKTLYGLIGVHKALLNEHHDFFLASQHPSASPALHRLAIKYSMPARMWKHGIHSFLELLRHQLPQSIEFMIQFIIHAYQMMSLLLETVPSFEETWIECLGDLSRYRMAVEDEDVKDREIWAQVARYWYCKAADKMPTVGRLYHHLAILARGNPLQQLYLYSRSLTSAQPFLSARESVQSLLEPAIKGEKLNFLEIDVSFIKVHAALFYRDFRTFSTDLKKFHELLDPQIDRLTAKWREYGVYTASSNIGAMLDFGNRNHLTQVFEICNFLAQNSNIEFDTELQTKLQQLQEPIAMDPQALHAFNFSLELFFETLKVVLQRPYDKNCQPFLHVTLSFLQTLLSFRQYNNNLPPDSMSVIRVFLDRTPWRLIVNCCNTSIKIEEFGSRFETEEFLTPEKIGESGCLPEDYLLWGLVYTQAYFPPEHFANANTDEERSIELPSTMHVRAERNLHLAFKIARENDDILSYSSKLRRWKLEESDDVVMVDVEQNPSNTSTRKFALVGNDIKNSSDLLQIIVNERIYERVVITEKTVMSYRLDSQSTIADGDKSNSNNFLKLLSNLIHDNKISVIDEYWNDKSDVLEQQDISSALSADVPSGRSSEMGDTLINTVKNAPHASQQPLLGGGYTMVMITDDTKHQEKAKQNDISFVAFDEVIIRADQAVSTNTPATPTSGA